MTFFVAQIETRTSIKAAVPSCDFPDILAFCGLGLLVSVAAATCSWLLQVPGPMF